MKHKTLLWMLVFLLCAGAASAATQDFLVSCFDFETNTNDYLGNNDLNNVGGTFSSGHIGNAIYFDGSTYANTSAFTHLTTNKTIVFWVKSTQTADTGVFSIYDGVNPNDGMLGIANSGAEYGYVPYTGGGWQALDADTDVFKNNWQMITFSQAGGPSGANVKHWINTTNIVNSSYNGFSSDNDNLFIGARGDLNQFFTGYMDTIMLFNQSMDDAELAIIFNSGVGVTCAEYLGVSTTTNINFTITDDWNGSTINDFNISLTWANGTNELLGTTNGYIGLTNVSDSNTTINVTYYGMTNYFNKTLLNQAITANTTNSVTTTTYQAVACFNATERISGNAITPDNVTIGSTTRTSCFNITAGSHNAMAQLAGWDSKNQTFTIPALSNATYTIANMSYNTLTIYAIDIHTGAYISNYQLNLTSLNYSGWAGEHYASTTNQTFSLINGTYNVAIDASGYALQDAEVNVSVTGDGNYTFNLYPTNSLNITFYDEADGSILNTTNITFEIILDDANATIGWTANATYWVDGLDAGDYEIRYRGTADGYGERSYYFTLTNRTYNALSLYLLNDSSTESITTTLYDEYGNTLEGYTLRLLRYYASLSGYVVVDEGQTNSEGVTIVSAIRNGPYYKFRIVDPDGEVLKTTSATQIYDTSISLYVTLGEGIGETLTNLNGISYELVYLTASDQFRFTWDASDGLIVSATTYVYTTDPLNGDTLVNSSTSTSASGTMYIGIAAENDTTYKAMSFVTFTDDTEPTLLDTLMVSFDEPVATFGKLGLFLTFIIVVTFALTGVFNPAAPCILVPLSLILTRIARLHALEWTWIVAITAVGAIILYIIRDKT